MTGGDYALISFSDLPTDATLRPWTDYDMSDENVEYRMKAFRAMKGVCSLVESLTKLCTIIQDVPLKVSFALSIFCYF